MPKKNNWKNRQGVVYSTSDDYEYDYDNSAEEATLAPEQQNLTVQLDKKARGGKQVTLITGFVGTQDDLKSLAKLLKSACGVGGSAKASEIIIQGDLRDKIVSILTKEGYRAKKSGG